MLKKDMRLEIGERGLGIAGAGREGKSKGLKVEPEWYLCDLTVDSPFSVPILEVLPLVSCLLFLDSGL
jgi:ABC-type uncharacterized transport system ATPase subunit